MLEFIDWVITNRHKPWDYILLAGIIFIADRLGRKFITHQVKKLFNVQEKHALAAYEARQIHIENMVEELLRKEGLPYDIKHIAESQKKSIPKNYASSLISLWAVMKRRKKRMKSINKAILVPLLSAIALFVKQVWGIPIGDEQIDMYADLILYVIMFIGLFVTPRKKVSNENISIGDTGDAED